MRIEAIIVANNGFIVEDDSGNFHIAKTLLEVAQIAGETVPAAGYSSYVSGYGPNDLNLVRKLARDGRKIEAIKTLRDCFTPRLGLREAKELVEELCL